MSAGYSASTTDTTTQTASQKQDLGSTGSSGIRSSVVNNMSFGSSKLSAATGDAGGLPVIAWVGLVGGIGILIYWMLRKRH